MYWNEEISTQTIFDFFKSWHVHKLTQVRRTTRKLYPHRTFHSSCCTGTTRCTKLLYFLSYFLLYFLISLLIWVIFHGNFHNLQSCVQHDWKYYSDQFNNTPRERKNLYSDRTKIRSELLGRLVSTAVSNFIKFFQIYIQ